MNEEKRDANNLTPGQLELKRAIALHRMPDPSGKLQLRLVNTLRRGSKKWANPTSESTLVGLAINATTQRKAT